MSIMQRLKEATRKQHEELEQAVDLMSETLSIEDYKSKLLKFYRFYSFIEPRLASFEWDLFGYDFPKRRKLPLLLKDLQSLDIMNEAKKLEGWEGLPDLNGSIGKAFGCLYVLEGANLGGQVISRHLKLRLGLDESNGAAFFSGYGKETATAWKEFGIILENFASEYQNDEEIISGANETFEGFARCFRETYVLDLKI
ncbi:MAG: hypothetical protein D6687_04545 [Acidobacteria bacterium]|jgi:heme oxygenase|nr:MAG: hypothetical protein D6687_04545 [Acidobacteriota bacterium]GIU82937.1 MAG: heme oxygenase [Pyrinomonadaceae bacterium]